MVSSEMKLITATAGLYSAFLSWGYLQEKITGIDYVSPHDSSVTGRWTFSFVLNGKHSFDGMQAIVYVLHFSLQQDYALTLGISR